MPYESTRRHIEVLRRSGFCTEREGGGFKISASLLGDENRRSDLVGDLAACLSELVNDLEAIGLGASPDVLQGSVIPSSAMSLDVVRASSDFVIRTIEALIDFHGDVVSGIIYTSIYVANVRTANPLISGLRDLNAVQEFRPVSVRMLAQRIGIPFETVRRHCRRMRERGEITAVDRKGVALVLDMSEISKWRMQKQRMCADLERLIAELHRAGICFEGQVRS